MSGSEGKEGCSFCFLSSRSVTRREDPRPGGLTEGVRVLTAVPEAATRPRQGLCARPAQGKVFGSGALCPPATPRGRCPARCWGWGGTQPPGPATPVPAAVPLLVASLSRGGEERAVPRCRP